MYYGPVMTLFTWLLSFILVDLRKWKFTKLTSSKGHGLQFEMGGFRFVLCLLIFIACDHNYD